MVKQKLGWKNKQTAMLTFDVITMSFLAQFLLQTTYITVECLEAMGMPNHQVAICNCCLENKGNLSPLSLRKPLMLANVVVLPFPSK